MTEIFIENQRVDVTADISAMLTFAIDDIKDFASRNCTFSKTIVLPGTATNNKAFGHIFNATVSNPYFSDQDNVLTNFNASVQAKCIMFQDNIQVFKGTLRLLEIVIVNGIAEYEVAVFGELGGLILKLGNLALADLDFSEYDHVYNTTNITASWDNASGMGYFYPLGDYGQASVDKINWDIRTFRPALFVREYIDKIFTDAGYSWTSALLDTTRFKKLVIPNNQKNLSTRQIYNLNVGPSGFVFTEADGANKLIPFPITTIVQDFTPNGANTEWTYTGLSGVHQYLIDFFGTWFKNSTVPFIVQVRVNGVTLGSHTFESSTAVVPTAFHLVGTGSININNGDVVSVNVNQAVATDYNLTLSTGPSFFRLQPPNALPVTIQPGDVVDINASCIPLNVKQVDFISSIIKLFNLYVYEDNFSENKLHITPYVDFYDTDVDNMVDWTYKMDRSRAIRLKPMSELNSRYYNFEFKADNDYYNEIYRKTHNEQYGSYIYDSAFDFANEKTDIPLIFSPTVLVGYAGADKIVSVYYKKNAGVEETFGTNIRIIQTKKITGVDSWAIKDGTTTLQSGLTTYGYGGHYDDPDAPGNDIHFGVPAELFFTLVSGAINVTQFNVYWSPYMAEITDKDSKMLTAHFKLTNKDIFDLDFSKPVHVDGSIWRLNKIIDWNASVPDVCKCELIKIINLIY